MANILITSGPTRQYIDPVRYLTNASSGKMGACIANSCLTLGHQVTIISGPVSVNYPSESKVINVTTTDEMLEAARRHFDDADGVIGAAAPCDYSPRMVPDQKIKKTGNGLTLHLEETPDIIATLGGIKRADQWIVGFALETDDQRFRALTKLETKCCDLIVLNGPSAMDSPNNTIEILDPTGRIVMATNGSKPEVADAILHTIETKLISS